MVGNVVQYEINSMCSARYIMYFILLCSRNNIDYFSILYSYEKKSISIYLAIAVVEFQLTEYRLYMFIYPITSVQPYEAYKEDFRKIIFY